MSEKVEKLVKEISELKVMEILELQKNLEEHFGISAQAFAMGGGAATNEAQEEKSGPGKVSIIGKGFTKERSAAIKSIKEVLDIGLADAKRFIDAMDKDGKVTIIDEIGAEEAKKIVETLTQNGINIETVSI